MERMRLNKFLAHSGVCSRRDADVLIGRGEVLVNGFSAQPGQTVSEGDTVTVAGRPVTLRQRTVVLAFYKPAGVTCTERDPYAEKKITDMIQYPVRVTYAGRLDRDSEGLLLLTNDGDLIQGMMRGANGHEKEYLVKVDKEITDDFLLKLSEGIYLKELNVTTKKCAVEKAGKTAFRIVLTQGLNRQIRRMCAACGYQVRFLKRIRVMHVSLGDLKPGEYRELSQTQIAGLYRDCGLLYEDAAREDRTPEKTGNQK